MTGRNERVVWAIFWAGFKGDPAVELYLNTFLVHFFPVKTTKLACFYIKNWEGEEEDFTDMMLPRSECERHCDLWELVCMRSSVTSRVITVTCAITAHPPAESATPTGGWTVHLYTTTTEGGSSRSLLIIWYTSRCSKPTPPNWLYRL